MTKSIAKKSTTGSFPPAVPLAITPTFSPWTHTSDDSYIYRLSLVLATATVSFNLFVCLCVYVCVTFVVFTDCESCPRPIYTNPGSMEAGEYELTRGTCFLACRLELDARCCGFRGVLCVGRIFFLFFCSFSFERTRPAASTRPPCLMYPSTSNEARPRERSNRGRFLPSGKKVSSYRGAFFFLFFFHLNFFLFFFLHFHLN